MVRNLKNAQKYSSQSATDRPPYWQQDHSFLTFCMRSNYEITFLPDNLSTNQPFLSPVVSHLVSHLAWHETRKWRQKSDSDFSFVDSSGNSISPCWLVLFRSKAFIQIKERWKFLISSLSTEPNRSNGTFFLNLHRIGYTVFLILCSMKLRQIHEDSNIYVEERRIIKSELPLWRDTLRD